MSQGPENKTSKNPFQVMVVDDSAVIRGLLSKTLDADPDIKIVASADNGSRAVAYLEKRNIEVVVLDIEMPVMDGLTALPKLLNIDPNIKVIMASTLTQSNAQISMKALSLGATDYIPKPSANRELHSGTDFERELVEKVKALGEAYRLKAPRAARKQPSNLRDKIKQSPRFTGKSSGRVITLRKSMPRQIRALAIGSSTGGPPALLAMLRNLKGDLDLPIFITQHMPPTFTTILAEHIKGASGMECAEAVDGETVVAGRIYVAPGDHHMTIRVVNGEKVIKLNQDPPVNYCRPAVDPMLLSIAQAYGQSVLVVILTGMGQDGLKGGQAVVDAGGTVISQDEFTSVVWGMPGAVAEAGICSAVLPLAEIMPYVRSFPLRLVS